MAELEFVDSDEFDLEGFEKQNSVKCELRGIDNPTSPTGGGVGAARAVQKPVCVADATVMLGHNKSITLRVCLGNITQSSAAAIVNAANDRLDHAAGVARASGLDVALFHQWLPSS